MPGRDLNDPALLEAMAAIEGGKDQALPGLAAGAQPGRSVQPSANLGE